MLATWIPVSTTQYSECLQNRMHRIAVFPGPHDTMARICLCASITTGLKYSHGCKNMKIGKEWKENVNFLSKVIGCCMTFCFRNVAS